MTRRLRVLLTGPDPRRQGGVVATLAAVRAHLAAAEVTCLPVGRRRLVDPLAAIRDPVHVRRLRRTHDLLQVNPSLRSRALLRDLSLARAWGGPTVAWVHGWDDALAGRIRSSAAARRVFARAAERVHFAVLAPHFATELGRLGVPEARITIVPPAWAGRPLPRSPRPDRILFLGRVEREKGILDLVSALRGRDATLVLAGEGSALGATLRLAAALGVRVEPIGWVEGEAKWRALAESTLFVLPSHGEGVPVALLEAMAAGVPSLATPVGGIPWLAPGVELVHGDLAGAVARLLADGSRREALSEAGRQRAAAFAAPVVAAELERLWDRVVSS